MILKIVSETEVAEHVTMIDVSRVYRSPTDPPTDQVVIEIVGIHGHRETMHLHHGKSRVYVLNNEGKTVDTLL